MATGSLRATGANMDLIMANKRREEIKLKVLNDYVGGQTRLTMAAEMETAVPQRRRAAQTLRLEMESRIAEEAARREAAKRRKEYEVQQGAAIAKELERRKTVQDTKEREIVRICNESEELKDLEKKLKTAYMNKERAAQHEERMLRQRRDILREKAIDDAMEADRIAAEIADQEKGGSKKNVTARQKAGLEKQMKERECATRVVLRCLHAIDATRLQLSMTWVLFWSILSSFGPRRCSAQVPESRGRGAGQGRQSHGRSYCCQNRSGRSGRI